MLLFFNGIIAPALLIGAFGLVFGICLAYAARKFAVEIDPREEEIAALLPGADCGACGYPGCRGYATALVQDPSAIGACNVVSAENLEKIASVLGVTATASDPAVIVVACRGDCVSAKAKYAYEGLSSCRNAMRLGGGAKACFYGCLGLGDCAAVCPNDAISFVDGLATVNTELCGGCGACIPACPKGLIQRIAQSAPVYPACKTQEKGAIAKKQCANACLGCGLCAKACEAQAITLENQLPTIDYARCNGCFACVEKCPTGVLVKKG